MQIHEIWIHSPASHLSFLGRGSTGAELSSAVSAVSTSSLSGDRAVPPPPPPVSSLYAATGRIDIVYLKVNWKIRLSFFLEIFGFLSGKIRFFVRKNLPGHARRAAALPNDGEKVSLHDGENDGGVGGGAGQVVGQGHGQRHKDGEEDLLRMRRVCPLGHPTVGKPNQHAYKRRNYGGIKYKLCCWSRKLNLSSDLLHCKHSIKTSFKWHNFQYISAATTYYDGPSKAVLRIRIRRTPVL